MSALPKEMLVAHVSSSYENVELARKVIGILRANDFAITTDWTVGDSGEHDRARARRTDGFRGAEVLILIAPAGRSSHVEMGLAIGYGMPVVVFAESPEALRNKSDGRHCAFYSHIACTITHDINGIAETARKSLQRARGR